MKYIKTLPLVLTMIWTVSYGQTGKDSLTCYTTAELQKIALKVVLANELDTVLKLTQEELFNQSVITDKQMDIIIANYEIIRSKDSIISKHDNIIDLKDKELIKRDNIIAKQETQKKLLKTGWIASIGVMIVTMLFISI